MDASAVFNALDLAFAQDFSAYYGCSLGEALGTMYRSKADLPAFCATGRQAAGFFIQVLLSAGTRPRFRKLLTGIATCRRPAFWSWSLMLSGPRHFPNRSSQKHVVKIGTRSKVFECDGQLDLRYHG